MKIYHCPNKKCKKPVMKVFNGLLSENTHIQIKCFHCGEWVEIITEKQIIIKKLAIIE